MRTKRNKSSSPRFNLNYSGSSGKAKDPLGINLMYRYKKDSEGKTVLLKYSIRKKVRPKHWDNKSYRVKKGVKLPESDAKKLNDTIRSVEDTCTEVLKLDTNISIDNFKLELDYALGFKNRPKGKSDTTLLAFIETFISRSTLDNRTIQKFSGVKKHLEDYQKHLKEPITFDT